MPREPELYKDKIEVSLDGRQIFYLFFGGAVIVGLVFVLGVLVGRRVEARGHLDRAETQAETDPLAALDRLERPDRLSFHGSLRGSEAPTEVEKAIGELEKRRAGQADKKPDRKPEPVAPSAGDAKPVRVDRVEEPVTRTDADKPREKQADKHEGEKKTKRDDAAGEARAEPKAAEPRAAELKSPEAKSSEAKSAEAKSAEAKSSEAKSAEAKSAEAKSAEARPERPDAKRSDASKPVTRPEAKETRADAKSEPRDGKPEGKPEAKSEVKSEAKYEAKSEAKSEPKADADTRSSAEGKPRFTLQLSSFQDKAEAEAFLTSTRSAGYQPYLIEADVAGKGTFYRVRLGSYRSLDAANGAKADYEKAARKTAQVMRL